MPRSLVLGNGNILVALDHNAEVRDFYFPYVGLENHVGGHHQHKLGVWVDGRFSWFDDGSWEISIDCGAETLSSVITAKHHALGVEIRLNDIVYNEKNIFLRTIKVKNTEGKKRAVKLFFHQQFELYQSHPGDTAYFDPLRHVIIHYKGRRVFLVNTWTENRSFDDYVVGIYEIEGKEGTYKDAEDGMLTKNPIEHGRVDSTIGVYLDPEGGAEQVVYYWLAAGTSVKEVNDLSGYILEKTPEHLMKTTQDFWHAWVNKQNFSFYGLDEPTIRLFKKSLLFLRAHVGDNGSVIASADSDMLQHGRDTYSYVWPRDAAYAAMALDKAGDSNVARRFFEFCNETVSDDGYFMHKYRPDKSIGSSWHPWIRDGKPELPIQEDETALVIYALWRHYELSRDLEFVESVYNSLIKKAADFMVGFRHSETALPYPSYDLWEEKYGISTFTSSAVYGALVAAGKFARLLGKNDSAQVYETAAAEIRRAILKYLYSDVAKTFSKLVEVGRNGKLSFDETLDMSSIYGIYKFGVADAQDERVVNSIKAVEGRLLVKTSVGGIPRYAGDQYYRTVYDVPGNPWFVTTLWFAQYYIAAAKSEKDLEPVKRWLSWTVRFAFPSGILSEQIHPYTGAQLSAAPLAWSHAEFVITVIKYLQRIAALGIAPVSHPMQFI